MSLRIIWIPWTEAEAGEFIERSDQWNEVSQKTFHIITYAPGTTHDVLDGLKDGSIYMRGHGMPGNPSVTTRGKALHIHHSIERLIEMGLDVQFTGKIKFYSCYSAVDSVQKMRDEYVQVPKLKLGPLEFGSKFATRTVDKGIFEGSRDCLAKRGAAYFRGKGFTRCVFQGYPGPLSGKMELKTDEELATGHYRKHCLQIDFNQGAPVSRSGIESVGRRASKDRVNF
ncbi:MAG: hypothetical protein KJO11_07525 [Gemmatimonadetes bacterium]|nr:hypothetical protein [Gemmatimonadota bacterium]